MCADQPPVRAHAKSAGVIAAGMRAISSTTAPQNSTFVSSGRSGCFLAQRGDRRLLERLGDLDPRRAELLAPCAEDARARILGAVDAMAEAHDPVAARQHLLDVPLGVARAATASSIGSTRAGAPPCSGPESVPTADARHAAQSAPVDAAIRAVNVEAFMPCSVAETQ